MTPPRRRGRRVPPKHGARHVPPSSGSGSQDATEAVDEDAVTFGAAPRPYGTRSQNRASKRATDPNRVRGRVTGRKRRGYSPAVLGLAIAVVVVGAAVFLIGNPFGGASASASPGPSGTPGPTRLLPDCPTAAPEGLAAGEKETVTIATSLGNIVIEVDANLAPVAAANFVALADCGYFDGVIFHRVVPDFVIQGGDGQYAWSGALDQAHAGQGGPGYEFDDETINGEYVRGTVAMANSGPNTNGSQFFICVADLTTQLGKSYTIFGHVTSGMEIVDQIVGAPRDGNDFPDDPVVMQTVTVANAAGPTPAPTAAPSPPTSEPPATASPASSQ